MKIAAAFAGLLAFMSAWSAARPAAADIALTASNAINVVLEELVPQFERASGHKVTMRLGVAVTTVRTHLSSVYEKLRLKSRVELALYATRASRGAA